jgi:CubicO group peptidase (beta-lactamase class C family)
MTVQDLLRHTAGLPYGELTQNAAVKDALAKAGLFKPGVIEFDVRDMTGAEQVERLARIPLLYQPGTTWEYSLASDVLGRVVEAASRKRLGDFLSERLFKPRNERHRILGAGGQARPPGRTLREGSPRRHDDQADRCREAARKRLRRRRRRGDRGRLLAFRTDAGQRRHPGWPACVEPHHHQAHDRRPPGIEPAPGSDARWGVLRASTYTFGLGFAVRPSDGIAPVPGSAGDFNWGGYAGTVFWVDPKEELVAVFMVQSAGALRLYHRTLFRQLVYQAIVD